MKRLLHHARRFGRIASNPGRRLWLSAVRSDRPGPRVVANSIPKAGTHLLARCLNLLPGMVPYHDGVFLYHTPRHTPQGKRRWLARMGGGCYVMAHLPYKAEHEATLAELGLKHLLIVRDPRDIVVSWVKFEMSQPYLPYYAYFHSLPDWPTRLLRAIEGDEAHGVSDIGRRISQFTPWLETEACAIRFEELVGERGGGSAAQQRAAIERIAAHLGIPLTRTQIAAIGANLFSSRSRTFRKGVRGAWTEQFSPRHVAAFKRVAGEQLIALGYAEGFSW